MSPTDTPVLPFADLSSQLLEASTRALTVSADLYTEVVRTQADATTALIEAYTATGRQTAARGGEAVEVADEAATKVVRGTARATKRATKRTASATRKAAAAAPRKAAATAKAAVEAPIAGYDDLTAGEVVERLPGLSQEQLAAVDRYERAHEDRSTVLDRVDALSGDEPWQGYDAQSVPDIRAALRDADDATVARVHEYERRHKGRAGVLDASQRTAAHA